jgi:hypothetical protein
MHEDGERPEPTARLEDGRKAGVTGYVLASRDLHAENRDREGPVDTKKEGKKRNYERSRSRSRDKDKYEREEGQVMVKNFF